MANWNPWHGCHKLSAGCQNCYVYRMDERRGKDASLVTKLKTFDLPLKKNRNGEYKIVSNETVYTCFTSDFFVEEADIFREEAWDIIRARSDVMFLMITKRIDRFKDCTPLDWENGYDNVTICCTVENQDRANYRLPIYLNVSIKHKIIICEPLLEPIDLSPWLNDTIQQVVVGGESGDKARLCKYEWILDIRRQCLEKNISFWFKQTGAKFSKDGKLYRILRNDQHKQARKAGIDYKADYPIFR